VGTICNDRLDLLSSTTVVGHIAVPLQEQDANTGDITLEGIKEIIVNIQLIFEAKSQRTLI
jgi:hypothetical protein